MSEKRRFIDGPTRMYSDALMWMKVAHDIHKEASRHQINNIAELLIGEHSLISLRGSVEKYCYAFAIELYLKWMLWEAKIQLDKPDRHHGLSELINKIPQVVQEHIRYIYDNYQHEKQPQFRMIEAHVHGVNPVTMNWSTFDQFIKNIDDQKFMWRYAEPENYSIFETESRKLSKQMNTYMDSDDFFELGEIILRYKPDLADYERPMDQPTD